MRSCMPVRARVQRICDADLVVFDVRGLGSCSNSSCSGAAWCKNGMRACKRADRPGGGACESSCWVVRGQTAAKVACFRTCFHARLAPQAFRLGQLQKCTISGGMGVIEHLIQQPSCKISLSEHQKALPWLQLTSISALAKRCHLLNLISTAEPMLRISGKLCLSAGEGKYARIH